MAFDRTKAPFIYPGGKSAAAQAVWDALGDPTHYVEPFAGSLAVLLRRPHEANRSYFSETVNDADGMLVNAWRSIQLSPEETALHCSWPVSEADQHARHCALIRWRNERELEHLMGDPEWHDPKMAGWWLYGINLWIGTGWCSGQGPWWPDEEGKLTEGKREQGVSRKRPHVSSNGQGLLAGHRRAEVPVLDRIYHTERKQRARLLGQVRAQAFPTVEELDGGTIYIECAAKDSVAAAIIQYAEDLGEPKLWLCSFAASLTALEEIKAVTKPQRVVLDRIQLSRGPHLVAFIRRHMRGSVAKVHAKLAVLRGSTTITLMGSANLSRNAGVEVLCVSADPDLADWAESVIMRLEAGGKAKK